MFIFSNFNSKYDRIFDVIFKLFVSYYCVNIYTLLTEIRYKNIDYITNNDISTQTEIQLYTESLKTISSKKDNSTQTDNNFYECNLTNIPSESFLRVGQYLYDSQENSI